MLDVRSPDFLQWAGAQGFPIPPELELAPPVTEEPKGKRLKGMNKLLLAMAITHYGFKPGLKNDAATVLSGLLDDMGQPMSDDTIRDILKAASDALKPAERPRNNQSRS